MTDKPSTGSIGWIDLTVENADEVRDFYSDVAGWKADKVDMGDYSDYMMSPPGGNAVSGVCHARGGNADMPAVWMLYIVVDDLDASISSCNARGGSVVAGPKTMGDARYCVIRDPAGAMAALYQP
ncbi:MAG: VOC family protein [Gammaproteobacteria bacterium]|nr:VOC family protein [Gammaproteobacteria bacterium]NNF62320.1 VOC family protein [Gammaproteobacteria bacterium]NNM20884.1 VOC family protein [Gammaproteobacteria bacterium]